MRSPSGRGPRDSAHASGGSSVAYKAPGTGTKLRYDDSGFGALPRAVANCVVGGDQPALSSLNSSKRGASKAWRGCQSQRQQRWGRLRAQGLSQIPVPQLLALDQIPGAGRQRPYPTLPTHPDVVMDQMLMLVSKRLLESS